MYFMIMQSCNSPHMYVSLSESAV